MSNQKKQCQSLRKNNETTEEHRCQTPEAYGTSLQNNTIPKYVQWHRSMANSEHILVAFFMDEFTLLQLETHFWGQNYLYLV